jgi:DNA invertase Pin-like site-specific DNA recombinase
MPTASSGRKKAPAVRAITYERISLDKTGEEAGLARQTKDNKGYCARRGWTVVADLVDDDISASRYSKKKRPGYLEAIRMITDGEADAIVAYHLDRLWRRPAELEHLIDLVEEHNVIVATLNGEVDLMTGEGRYFARSMVNVAAMESDNISRRTSRQWQAHREKGLPVVRRRLFGWLDPTTINPVEADWILEAIDAILEGETLRSVARHWNRMKVAHIRDNAQPWEPSVVRRIIANPHHAGLVSYRGEVIGEGTWEGFVDRVTFERLRSVLDAKRAASRQAPRRRRFLTALLSCGGCGSTLRRGGPASGPERNWRCYRSPRFPRACNAVSINAEHLEQLVRDIVFERVNRIDPADLVPDDDVDKRTKVTLEIGRIERKQKELALLYTRDKISLAVFEEGSHDLEAQLAALRAQLAQTTRSPLAPYAGRPGALEADWEAERLSIDQQRAIVAATLGKITIAKWDPRGPRRFDPDRIILGNPKKARPTGGRSEFYTINEAATRAGMTANAMYGRHHERTHGGREKVAPPFRKVFGQWMVPIEDFKAWVGTDRGDLTPGRKPRQPHKGLEAKSFRLSGKRRVS